MSGGSCDPGALGCKSSLWDLLEPALQHHVIELALGLSKSEAKQKYQIINSMHTPYRFSDFQLHPISADIRFQNPESSFQNLKPWRSVFSTAKQKRYVVFALHSGFQIPWISCLRKRAVPSNWHGMCSELQELLRKICADEQCLLVPGAGALLWCFL